MFAFTLRQIEVFIAVCESGGFRRAADLLDVSEASVSDHIHRLENVVGSTLFIRRKGAAVQLSDKGENFRIAAEEFVRSGVKLARSVDGAKQLPVELKICIGPHILEDFVRPALASFMRSNPHISFSFIVIHTRAEARKALLLEEPDGALLTIDRLEDLPGSVPMAEVELAIFGSAEIANRAKQEGVDKIPFLMPRSGSEEEFTLLNSLRTGGVNVDHIAGHYQFYDVGIGLARKGVGAICTLRSVADSLDPDAELREIATIETQHRRLFLSRRIDPEVRRSVTEFFSRVAGPHAPLRRRKAEADL